MIFCTKTYYIDVYIVLSCTLYYPTISIVFFALTFVISSPFPNVCLLRCKLFLWKKLDLDLNGLMKKYGLGIHASMFGMLEYVLSFDLTTNCYNCASLLFFSGSGCHQGVGGLDQSFSALMQLLEFYKEINLICLVLSPLHTDNQFPLFSDIYCTHKIM